MMRNPGMDAFSPALLRLQERPPSPLPRVLLALVVGRCAALGGWSALGRLDVVAVAQGRLVPLSYVKVVQPADGGIVRDILVREGQTVRAGQVLARMDAAMAEADRRRMERERDGLDGAMALLLSADALPPGVFPLLMPSIPPISSMTWQANLLTPAPATRDGWWLLRSRGDYAENGCSSQIMEAWNVDGEPVMAGMQSIALFG